MYNPNISSTSAYSTVMDDKIVDFEDTYGAHHYDRLNLVVRQAKGCWLTDATGRKYLDCLAAYSAANPCCASTFLAIPGGSTRRTESRPAA